MEDRLAQSAHATSRSRRERDEELRRENARLLAELEARDGELAEALEQQTATGAILRVIAGSPTDIQPVLDVVSESAARFCDTHDAIIFLARDDQLIPKSHYGPIPFDLPVMPATRDWVTGRALVDRMTVHVTDVTAVGGEFPISRSLADRFGHRTMAATPLMREHEAIGVLVIRRLEVKPFSDKQIGLLQTFAAQAAIAIENVRLFEEVQARNREISEALEQQVATGDILRVIATSPTDIQPVLDVVVESAARFCDTEDAAIFLESGGLLEMKAHCGPIPIDLPPLPVGRNWVAGRCFVDRETVCVDDLVTEGNEYPLGRQLAIQAGHRTLAGTPLLHDDKSIGVLLIRRTEVRPFSVKQINLLRTFADQAAIAIQNVRLFEQVQERTANLSEALEQQTATADVLKAISRSTFDLQAVLDTLAESASRLCDADAAIVFKRVGDEYRLSALFGYSSEFADYAKAHPLYPGRYSVTSRVALEARPIQVADVLADAEYGATDMQRLGGYRTILCVPILREGAPVGVFALVRSVVREFSPRQVDILQTFADQAGIAMENVRLFEEVRARTHELTSTIDNLQRAQDRLIQTEKLASLGQLTAGIAHEIKNPLNFVNNFASVSIELMGELDEALARGEPADAEIAELSALLKSNLAKIELHGKRADSIVRNMLLHSRQGSGEHRPTNVNTVVEESLNLAYHGARAERQGFTITLDRDFDPEAGEADLYPQDITRVLLNLIANGFYATSRRAAESDGLYEPSLRATTRNLGDRVEIRIRDNGTGIAPEVAQKMFTPFFTTKPAGEGTGLGLSLSHDIVVKQHAGTIEVATELGAFTEFRIVLPRHAAPSDRRGAEA